MSTDLIPKIIQINNEVIPLPANVPDIEELPANLPIQQWVGYVIRTILDREDKSWNLAHILAWGEMKYKEAIYQYSDMFNYVSESLNNLMTLGKNFPPSRRRELLEKGYNFPRTYYQELCSLPPEMQDQLLEEIREHDYKRADIRDRKRELGYTTPRTPYEIECDNDTLLAQNYVKERENGQLKQYTENLEDQLEQVTAERDSYQAEADHWRTVAEGNSDPLPVARRITCPHCGCIIEPEVV